MLAPPAVSSQDLPDISSVDKELSIPKTKVGAPAAGARAAPGCAASAMEGSPGVQKSLSLPSLLPVLAPSS